MECATGRVGRDDAWPDIDRDMSDPSPFPFGQMNQSLKVVRHPMKRKNRIQGDGPGIAEDLIPFGREDMATIPAMNRRGIDTDKEETCVQKGSTPS